MQSYYILKSKTVKNVKKLTFCQYHNAKITKTSSTTSFFFNYLTTLAHLKIDFIALTWKAPDFNVCL